MSVNIDTAAGYFSLKLGTAGSAPSMMKLHKLLYYAQAWHLAIHDSPLFNEDFEAWVHGPVHRGTFERFKEERSLYDKVEDGDYSKNYSSLSKKTLEHLDNVLEIYGGYSGTQLEQITHRESPWIEARKPFEPWESCSNIISNDLMKTYYRSQMG